MVQSTVDRKNKRDQRAACIT